MKHIRNFCIIAHIDHGKSTLADRLLERTGTITEREMMDQILDDNPLERERGITIKMHAIKLTYRARDGADYTLNLIDTPGHVDFTYEVSRSLNACEGALLVVDASQGVEAQTISNFYLALEANLEIIPVINKIDLPNAQIDVVKHQLKELMGCTDDEILEVSAKSNIGIDELLERIVLRVPPPTGSSDAPARALIFDSVFDTYRGTICYIRVMDGIFKENDDMLLFHTQKKFGAEEVGLLQRTKKRTGILKAGEVGYLIPGIKDVREAKVGDTITVLNNQAKEPLPGYKEVKPMVFSGVYPANMDDFEGLRDSLEKLQMNDASLIYEPETSTALGFGFRCGFLGLLHMEIIQERLEREYDQTIITTVPNVEYKVILTSGEELLVDNPASMPSAGTIEAVQEPFIRAEIITPSEYVGNLMQLCMERRGIYKKHDVPRPATCKLTFRTSVVGNHIRLLR
jgi:GTP-binding protein LepA